MQRKPPYKKSDEIFGSGTLLKEIAYYMFRLDQYERSLKFFDAAIEETPNDRRALIGRCRAKNKAAHPQEALEDINYALSLNPDDLGVLGDKAESIYLCSEFEEALVQNIRLLPKRRKPENFSMGVMHCTNAIENCLSRSGRPLRDHFKIIRKLGWKQNYAAQKPFEPTPEGKSKKKKKFVGSKMVEQIQTVSEPVQPINLKKKSEHQASCGIKDSLHSKSSDHEFIPAYTKPFPFKPITNFTSNISNYMAEKYLEKMYRDKSYLQGISKEPGVASPNKKGSIKLKQIAKNCHRLVSHKQEMLRSRRPFYFIKYQEGHVSKAMKERQKIELEHQQKITRNEADLILNKMMIAFKEKRLSDFLNLQEKLKRYCDSKPKKMLPNKATYMKAMCDTVCRAFYDVYRVNPNQNMLEQKKRIYATIGISLSREGSTDSVIGELEKRFEDYSKQVREFENRLKNAILPDEICWFYHELSRLHIEQKHFDLARVYARKCTQIANTINDEMWAFNSSMLICKSNMLQHNKNDAIQDLHIALKSAKKLEDPDKISYLEECLMVVKSIEFDNVSGLKELHKRERKIIQMMASTKMKEEIAHLFRQMASMPPSRRMTVIPGIPVNEKTSKQSKGARSMSIMPGVKASETVLDLKGSAKGGGIKSKDVMNFIELHL